MHCSILKKEHPIEKIKKRTLEMDTTLLHVFAHSSVSFATPSKLLTKSPHGKLENALES